MILDLPRNLVVHHSPSKSARRKGPVVWVLPAELAWEWFLPSESDSVLYWHRKNAKMPATWKLVCGQALRKSSYTVGLRVEQREFIKTARCIPLLLTTLFPDAEVTTRYQRSQRNVVGFLPYLRWPNQFSCSCKNKQHISKCCQCNHKYLEENDWVWDNCEAVGITILCLSSVWKLIWGWDWANCCCPGACVESLVLGI